MKMKIKFVGGAHATASDRAAIKKGLEMGLSHFQTKQKIFQVSGEGIERTVVRQTAEKNDRGETFLRNYTFKIEVT